MSTQSAVLPLSRKSSGPLSANLCFYMLLSLFVTNLLVQPSNAFLIPSKAKKPPSSLAYMQGRLAEPYDANENGILEGRLLDLKVNAIEEDVRRPPNPNLSAQDFVFEIIRALHNNGDPLPDSGFRVLLRSSTDPWKKMLYKSVGAPRTANEEVVASALGEAMARDDNQFVILVDEESGHEVSFPTDTLDYSDGTAWVECRLRDEENDLLLVVMGWQLHRRPSDGAWLVDQIDWQDFRDDFRPGIGREEWMRICG